MIEKTASDKKPKRRQKKSLSAKKKQQIKEAVIWAIAIMLWVGAAVIVAQYIVGYLMILILGQEPFIEREVIPITIFSALSYILAFCIIAFLPPLIVNNIKKNPKKSKDKIKPIDLKILGFDKWVTWADIGLSVGGLVVYFVLAAILLSVFNIFPWFNAEQTQNMIYNTNIYGFDRMLAFVVLVVVTPIAEELIFRGYLYGKMREKFSQVTTELLSVIISAVLVSIVFGIVHLQWNVGVNVFAMSLVACALREYTGTIHAGILLHMIKNGLAFYYLFVLGLS